ncbi:MAG: PilC/PilY family type IV pilus protein [Azonexus sp.]
MGGFNFANSVNGYDSTVLVNILTSYQANYYSVAPTTTNAKSLAWKGNRDQSSAPAFGSELGTPAYYDSPATNLKLGTAATAICTRTCVVDSDPGTPLTQAINNASPLKDGSNTSRYWYKSGATCVSTGTSGTDCSTLPAACGTPSKNDKYVNVNHNGCAWSGRLSKYIEGEGTYWYGGTCSGSCTGEGNVLGAASCPNGNTSTNYCNISGVSTVTRGSLTMTDALLNNSTGGCGDKTDLSQTCAVRQGFVGCSYSDQDPCADPAITPPGATDYSVYSQADKDDYLYHDCKADNGTSGNPSSSYLSNQTNSTFGADWANSTGANKPYVTTNPGASYPAVDMYSVNYLNWKFGPRGPNGHPIGRKTRLQVAKDVLIDVLDQLLAANKGINVGLMSFNQMEAAEPKNSSGAHLDKAILELNASTKASLVTKINALKASAATPLTESLHEAYLYFKGETPKFGSLTSTAKVGGAVNAGVDISADAMSGSKYKSPITLSCQDNLVILVSDGAPENDDAANTEIKGLPATTDRNNASVTILLPGNEQIKTPANPLLAYGPKDTNPSTTGNDYVLLDELASYMSKADAIPDITIPGFQTIQTSTVSFAGVDAPVLKNAAKEGGGKFYSASDGNALKEAILDLIKTLSQWQPQSSTPAVNYNANAGQSEDAYVGAISPSSNVAWQGTVKKYKFGFGETVCGPASCGNPAVCLIGQTEVDAVCKKNVEMIFTDTLLGTTMRKIRSEAVSFWIPNTLMDGGLGTSGGTGQILIDPARKPSDRALYTFLTGVSTDVLLSNANNAVSVANAAITGTLLGNPAMSATDRNTLINFALGSDGSNPAIWRTWAQFDSVHSKPITDIEGTNYTLYFLTSDGVLHAVDADTGIERWAYMVEEGLGQIEATKTNNAGNHLEVADGNPVVVTTADGVKLLVFGMRRGGRAYYALDITSVATPKFAWKITPSQICAGASCTTQTDFAELGYTWSTPVVGTVRGHKSDGPDNIPGTADDKFKPVLIFGGGYDTNQDSVSPVDDTMGRAVFVVDAATGNLIKKFSTIIGTTGHSVPADVLTVDATGDTAGTIDRVYAGDMGGKLWRMDLDDRTTTNSPTNWSIVQLAKLNTTGKKNKLFNRPTMAASIYRGQVFDAIFIGGGDLQNPTAFDANDSGSLFMVKDLTVKGIATQASPIPDAGVSGDFVDMTNNVAANALETITNASKVGSTLADDLQAAYGWVINLAAGEKISSDAQVYSGRLYVGSFYPKQTGSVLGACEVGGYGRQYAINALTSTPLRDNLGNLLYATSAYGGRSFGNVYGFGRGLHLIGKANSPMLGGPLIEAQKLSNNPVRVYWYSVPER